jgi:hypothetical protein
MASDRGFVAIMALMEAAFGAQEDARHELYRQRFKGSDDRDLKAAALRCIDECRAFPTIRDLLDRLPGRLTEGDAAEAAWTRVIASAKDGPTSYGPATGTRPTGTDLDEAALSAIGGPGGLRRIWEAEDDAEQMGFIRRDFLDRYRAAHRMAVAGFLPTGEPSPLRIDGPREGEPRRIGECIEVGPKGDKS